MPGEQECLEKWIPGSMLAHRPGMTAEKIVMAAHPSRRVSIRHSGARAKRASPESIEPQECLEKWIPGSMLAHRPGMTTEGIVAAGYPSRCASIRHSGARAKRASPESIEPQGMPGEQECLEKWIPGSMLAHRPGMTTEGIVAAGYPSRRVSMECVIASVSEAIQSSPCKDSGLLRRFSAKLPCNFVASSSQ
jgi:hypothetical protein